MVFTMLVESLSQICLSSFDPRSTTRSFFGLAVYVRVSVAGRFSTPVAPALALQLSSPPSALLFE